MDWKGRLGRETVGVALLGVLLLTGLYTSLEMSRSHRDIARQLETGAWFALAEDWENARTAVAAAESGWESRRDLSSLLADHTPMEEIDALFAQAGIHSAARNREAFASVCACLSRKVEAMGEAHRFSWQNLL